MLLTASTGCLQSLEASQVLTSVPEGATQEAHTADHTGAFRTFQLDPSYQHTVGRASMKQGHDMTGLDPGEETAGCNPPDARWT